MSLFAPCSLQLAEHVQHEEHQLDASCDQHLEHQQHIWLPSKLSQDCIVFALPQVDNFRRQFDHLDAGGQGRPPGPNLGQATSLPRERVREFQHEAARYMQGQQVRGQPPVASTLLRPTHC